MASHPPGSSRIKSYLSNLRFPYLLALTLIVLVADLAIPDMIPFVDEVLLGLAALVLSRMRGDSSSDDQEDSP